MKKILVIDDAEFILESTSTLLRFEGYDIITASDGLSGIEAAGNYRPDLILCDISMPGMDGYGVLEKIRSIPETVTTPFIFLTAFTDKANMRAGMEKGADDYLIKPFTREELIAAIDAQWKKSHFIEKQVQEKVDEVGRSITYALPHEFRTVLNQIVGSAKYLNNNAQIIEKEEITELSQDIISSAQRLMKITENYLLYIRIESFITSKEKRSQLRTFRTDEPVAMLFDIASNVAARFERLEDLDMLGSINNIYIEVSTESFHKVVEELLDNAFKFSDPGNKVMLNVWQSGQLLYISIEDQGRGMSKDHLQNVGAYVQFERQVYEQQGVGLGLSIAKKLVELHDGAFEIRSEIGVGTIVNVSFYCKEIKRA